MIKLPVKLTFLLLAAVSAGVLLQQTKLLALALSRIDPLPETRAMVAEERYAEAANNLGFFMDYEYVNQNPKARSLYTKISNNRKRWRYQLGKLSEGLLSGTSDETIGQAAGVATDFFVIGDIRDLVKQGVNLVKGEEVDKVLVSLAALGVVATAAQVISGAGTVASGGAAAPAVVGTTVAKSGLIALKTARKLGKLPPWLGKAIIKAAKNAKQSKSIGALTGMLGDISTLAKTRGGFEFMSKAKDAASLKRMAKFADTFGAQSSTIYRIGGNLAVNVAQQSEKFGKDTIKLAVIFGQGGLRLLDRVGTIKFTKIISRSSKIVYKGDILKLLANLLLMLPIWVLYLFVVLGAIIWVPWRILSVFCKRLYRNLRKTPRT